MKNIHRIDPGNSIRGRLKEMAPSSMRLETITKGRWGRKTGEEIYMAGSRKRGSEIKRLGYCIRVSEDNELRYCINAAVR